MGLLGFLDSLHRLFFFGVENVNLRFSNRYFGPAYTSELEGFGFFRDFRALSNEEWLIIYFWVLGALNSLESFVFRVERL